MSEFDDALTLRPGPDLSYVAELLDDWAIGGKVNGGFLMALAARALTTTMEAGGAHRDPLVASAFFLSAATAGPASLQTEVLRAGRYFSTGQVSVRQEHEGRSVERVRMSATCGDLVSSSDPVLRAAQPPDMPPVQDCFSVDDAPAELMRGIRIAERLDMRLDPATIGWALGKPSRQGMLRGYVRFRDGREIDPVALLLMMDAFPPVTFDYGITGWAPTLELTSHVRAVPAPGWLQIELTAQNLAGGLTEEDSRVWDAQGRLVAQSRQLAGYRVA